MVILIDRTADSTERIVAVRQDIRDRKLLQAGCPRCLDDAHVCDVMRCHLIEADLELLIISGQVMAVKNRPCHRLPARLLPVRFLSGHLPYPGRGLLRIRHDIGSIDQVYTLLR